MNLILFHIGRELPQYLKYGFRQIRLFNPDITIYFITDKKWLKNSVFTKYGIITVDKDEFHSDKIDHFEPLLDYSREHFWTITASRLIYIENFLKAYNLTDVYHFENDILLYYPLEKHHQKFLDLYKSMAITPGGADRCMTGFMFIKNWEVLAQMTEFFIQELKEHGRLGLREVYKTDMIHEMSLMKGYANVKGQEHLRFLPILPFGPHAYNYEEFNSVFDPASWGQYVGGIPGGEGPGAKPPDLYISQVLIANPDYTVIWEENEDARKVPYFKYNNNWRDCYIKINNLHIHSKNLHDYIS